MRFNPPLCLEVSSLRHRQSRKRPPPLGGSADGKTPVLENVEQGRPPPWGTQPEGGRGPCRLPPPPASVHAFHTCAVHTPRDHTHPGGPTPPDGPRRPSHRSPRLQNHPWPAAAHRPGPPAPVDGGRLLPPAHPSVLNLPPAEATIPGAPPNPPRPHALSEEAAVISRCPPDLRGPPLCRRRSVLEL